MLSEVTKTTKAYGWEGGGRARVGRHRQLGRSRAVAAVLVTVSVAAGGAVLASLAVAQAGSGPAAAETVAADEQGFALDLLGRLGPASPNLVLSPSSLATLLAMLEPGAAGTTAAGIAQALHSSALGADQQAARWGALTRAMLGQAARDGIALQSGNEILAGDGLPGPGRLPGALGLRLRRRRAAHRLER